MSGRSASEYAWLLPSALIAEVRAEAGATRPRQRRTARDWLVDTIFFLVALGYAAFAAWSIRRPDSILVTGGMSPGWLIPIDTLLGLLGSLALWWRRRWPVGMALVALPISLFSVTTGIAQMIVYFTVAVHRRFAVAAAFGVAYILGGMIYSEVHPDEELGRLGSAVFTVVFVGGVLAWGMFVRARRQLVLSLRDRADRAEAEQQLRIAQARQVERTRIAREMHDVLAHRISLLSLHAGALEFRPDASPEEISRAAGVIRTSAHQALEDLREVIGVLREETDPAPERPQPTLADLPALVAESRQAGVRVSLHTEVAEPDSAPAAVGRGTYRIIQEGLTNARKHAPGARVSVSVTGGPGDGLNVQVRNRGPMDPGPVAPLPGAGTGLIGLAERTNLAGGRLRHGRTADGDFHLTAWLPWPS
nr:histidine kinase [Micromonospora sp. DSM 115978]